MILELQKEIKELKTSRFTQNTNSNPKRTSNSKLIANQKYCYFYDCNPSYYGKECKFLADNHQPKATTENTIEEKPVLCRLLPVREEEDKQLTEIGYYQ